MQKIGLKIVALSHSIVHTDNYAIVLGEKKGKRRLPIVIGAFEAQAIAVELEGMAPKRPLTHDLFVNSLGELGVNLQEVTITNFSEGVFFAVLTYEINGRIVEVDSRTSDAIALAIRTGSPIYTYESIMKEAGVVFDEDELDEEDFEDEEVTIQDMSVKELEALLLEAIEEENYEDAAKLRDEINNRKEA